MMMSYSSVRLSVHADLVERKDGHALPPREMRLQALHGHLHAGASSV
jgi:hypothetical protein